MTDEGRGQLTTDDRYAMRGGGQDEGQQMTDDRGLKGRGQGSEVR